MKSVDTGIFLHRITYSETSLIATFYTREKGLRKYLFKGGKKKAHMLFPLAICELSFYERKDSELLHLTAVESTVPLDFQFNPIKSTIAFFIAEIVKKSCHSGDRDEMMYTFVQQKILELNATDDFQLFPVQFLIDLTELLGIQPYVQDREGDYFNLDEGTITRSAGKAIRSEQGPGVQLITERLTSLENKEYDRSTREAALEVLLNYFRIHVPGFNQVDSYEVVREVLHG